MTRSINPLVYSRYFGELFCQSIDSFNRKNYYYPNHFHAQCSCHACGCWLTDDGLRYRLKDSDEFVKCILSRRPFTLNTVVLENIDTIKIKVMTQPWQMCDCQYCRPLHVVKSVEYTVKGGNVTMRDIKNLRKMISSVQVPSILPLEGSKEESDDDEEESEEEERRVPGGVKMNRLFLLKGGNTMELDAKAINRTLNISIITTSDDGSRIDNDKAHQRGEIYMTASDFGFGVYSDDEE